MCGKAVMKGSCSVLVKREYVMIVAKCINIHTLTIYTTSICIAAREECWLISGPAPSFFVQSPHLTLHNSKRHFEKIYIPKLWVKFIWKRFVGKKPKQNYVGLENKRQCPLEVSLIWPHTQHWFMISRMSSLWCKWSIYSFSQFMSSANATSSCWEPQN